MDAEPLLMFMGGGRRDESRAQVEPRGYTVKEYAHQERVDQSTVRRWIAKGAVVVRRTPGGGIRIIGSR